MATTVKDVLAWADEVCTQAITEARSGDTGLVNRIGANSSLKLYFDNVHGTKAVPSTSLPAYYAGHFREITRLYEDYLRAEADAATLGEVNTLKESLDALKVLVDAQAQMLAVLQAAKKPAAKPAPVVEPVEPAEPVEPES